MWGTDVRMASYASRERVCGAGGPASCGQNVFVWSPCHAGAFGSAYSLRAVVFLRVRLSFVDLVMVLYCATDG